MYRQAIDICSSNPAHVLFLFLVKVALQRMWLTFLGSSSIVSRLESCLWLTVASLTRAQCVGLWTRLLLITSVAHSVMGMLLTMALLKTRGECYWIGSSINVVNHSSQRVAVLCSFLSLLTHRSLWWKLCCVKKCKAHTFPTYSIQTHSTCSLPLHLLPVSHTAPSSPSFPSLPRVSGGTGRIEAANLKCTSSDDCTFSTDTSGCTHSQDLVLQCSKL